MRTVQKRKPSEFPAVERLESRRLMSGTPLFGTTNLVSDLALPATHVDPNLLNPWGIAFAPGGEFWISDNNSGKSTLYDGTGNFKSGLIDVMNMKTGRFIGNLLDSNAQKIQIDHLWALSPGSGGSTENADTLYFTAGINDEADGLFGSIELTGVTTPRQPPPPVSSGGGGY